jgi:branched-subunit amino acid ABC-type transport system permease component
MAQLIINIIYSCLLYSIVSLAFAFIYTTAKFFNITNAFIFTLSAYFSFLFFKQLVCPLYLSILIAILLAVAIGVSSEYFFYKPLRKKNSHSFVLLIASLGMYVVLQNIISLIWGDATLSIRIGEVKVGHQFFRAFITSIQIITITVSIILLVLSLLFYKFTQLGRQMRAVSSNYELANVFGINSNKIILSAFAIGSGMAAIAGILVAFDTDIRPTMGFNLLLYGVVAMIIGGVGSIWGLVCGALLLATAQHFGAYYIDSKWMDAIAYVILILFLIWKPLGFSGQRLKKVEI